MQKDKKGKQKWLITVQSVYIFGREERLQSAYEIALANETIELKGSNNEQINISQDRPICSRVSSEKQAQEKTISFQIANIIEHAKSLDENIEPSLYFVDDDVSGASLERPGLDQLRDKAFVGEVHKVYILSPDRLSRKSAHQVLLIEELPTV